jgi:hypothetical protein
VNILIYLVAWLLKGISIIILEKAKKTQEITKAKCYFVFYSQKINFVSFNTIVIDLLFYGFRTLGHTRNLSFLEIIGTLVVMFLALFDICEIWMLTTSVVIPKN